MCHYKVPGQDMKILHRIAQDAGLKGLSVQTHHDDSEVRVHLVWVGPGVMLTAMSADQGIHSSGCVRN